MLVRLRRYKASVSLGVARHEAKVQEATVRSAEEAVRLTVNEYKAGTVDYTTVGTVQATALNAREQLINVQAERMTEAVDLIQALGGGWSAAELKGK